MVMVIVMDISTKHHVDNVFVGQMSVGQMERIIAELTYNYVGQMSFGQMFFGQFSAS
jgi:hypothetical protein